MNCYLVKKNYAPSSYLVSQSVGQSVSQSVGRSVSRSVGQSVSRSVGQSVSRSVGQSVSRSVSQSVGQSVGQSVSRSVCCPSSSHSPLTTTNPVQQNTLHLNSFPRRQNPSDKCRPLVAPPTPGTCLGTEHVVRIKLARWRSLCYQSCGTTCTA